MKNAMIALKHPPRYSPTKTDEQKKLDGKHRVFRPTFILGVDWIAPLFLQNFSHA